MPATGKPWPGVRLLLSDGRSVFAEAKTGDDGFYRHRYQHPTLKDTASLGPKAEILCQWGSERYPESKDVECLRVFAAAEGGHVASTAVRLAGRAGRSRTGRPDLRSIPIARSTLPARRSTFHGCARHADGDRFVVEPGKKLTVEVLGGERPPLAAAGGDAFGRGHVRLRFPPARRKCPRGLIRSSYSDQAGHRQAAAFQIGRPQAETLHLVLDLPKTVYYRGEIDRGHRCAACCLRTALWPA